jgi:hypothetical protein
MGCYYLFNKPVDKYAGLALIVAGGILVIVAALIALSSFYGYSIQIPRGQNIEDTITSLVNVLIELAIRLGFLGVMVWAGSILLRYGVQSIKSQPVSKQS